MIPKNPRIKLPGRKLKELYHEVFERDEWTCQDEDCPMKNPWDKRWWPLDYPHHIIFRSQGGDDTAENLITLCVHCHNKAHGINLR